MTLFHRVMLVVVLVIITIFCTSSNAYDIDNRLSNAIIRNNAHVINDPAVAQHSSKQTWECGEETTTENKCTFAVQDESEKFFTQEILKHGYNFVYLKLKFQDFDVNETKFVINKDDWIWTYKGDNGAHQYLYLPGDFGYLSFGLLWSYTHRKSMSIYINKTGDCGELKIGSNKTDCLIGKALGEMTSNIAKVNDNYNASYWCYNTRVWLRDWYIYYGCKNSVCTFQTFEYRCCKYHIDFIKRTRVVQCGRGHYEFGTLWWMLPIVIGETCFAFCPLLLTKLGMNVRKISNKIKKNKKTLHALNRSMTQFAESDDGLDESKDNNIDKYQYISTRHSNPITFFSTVFTPFNGYDLSGPIVSRLLRLWIIILPMTLSTVRVTVDYIYARNLVTDAVKKGALVGFSSLIAGPSEARKHFLYIFNGPVTALCIYIIFGCILIVCPRNLENFLNAGFKETHGTRLFLCKMPLLLKERWSGLSFEKAHGYHRIHKLFLAQIFMLLHRGFWKHCLKLFYIRWEHFIFPTMAEKLRSRFVAVLVSVLVLPIYFTFSSFELCFSVIYFLFPVINCSFAMLKAFLIHYFEFFNDSGSFMKVFRFVLLLPMLVLFFISWYVYCLLFFDGMWFLSKITMFTYSGIIAYPRISYGYLILVFMAIYYLTESLNAFGENYQQLLKQCIEVCERYQARHYEDSDVDSDVCNDIRNKYGIKRDLFYMIVDKHLPRRNQIFITVLKFTFVVTILTISVELLITFNKIQDLSLVSHVFTVLFICALPKIIRTMCIDNYRTQTRKRKLRLGILLTISYYVRQRCKADEESDPDVNDMDYLRSHDDETVTENLETEYCII